MRAISTFAIAAALAVARADDNEPGAGADVVTLTDDNFHTEVLEDKGLVMVEFYAPWCGHCKNLAPEWAKAATALKGIAKVAAIDAEKYKEAAGKYGARAYPTVKYFNVGQKISDECDDDPDYDCAGFDDAKCEAEGDKEVEFLKANDACCACGGGLRAPEPQPEDIHARTADDIIDWAYAKLEESGVNVTIPEVTNDESFAAKCTKKYCVVAVLPHLYDTGAQGRNAMLDVVGQVAKSQRSISSVVWVQGGNQEAFESAFNLNSGYPSVVAINKDRMRYGVHTGAFTVEAISKTLRSMQSGRLGTFAIAKMPAMVKSEPWDGGEYAVPEEEDEY